MPLWRECIEVGCAELTTGTRCEAHEREREAARPTRQDRGYDADHDRARAALKLQLPAFCGYGCGTWLEPDGDWVAAHVEDGRAEAGWLAACRSCNERAKRR